MKINVLSSVCAVLVVFAHFLTFAPQIHAQNTSPSSPIPGLRFDTPVPEQYTKQNFSLYFLSTYDRKSADILTVKKTIPTPQTISTTSPSSILDIIAPQVLAEESTASAEQKEEESTQSAVLASEEETVEQLIPSPTAKASQKPTPTISPSAKPSIKPSVKPSAAATATPTEKPSSSPTPTANPTTTPVPASQTPENSGGLSADKIFELVNNYRSSKGLPAVQKDERACEVARSRAPEVGAEISGGYMHRGIRERNLPYFNSEIIISMRSEEAAVNWWIGDYIHRVQMEGDYKYSCAACVGNSCVQEFTNFVPKG